MRPCGIAIPCPSPVEPSFSRAARLAATPAWGSPAPRAKTSPMAAKNSAFDATSRSMMMLAAGSRAAIWFTGARARLAVVPNDAGGPGRPRARTRAAARVSAGSYPPETRRRLYGLARDFPLAAALRARSDGRALDRLAVAAVILDEFLVFQHLPVELVGERVDRRVHVGIDALGVDVLAAHVHVRLHLLSQLVDRKHHTDVDHMIEMTVDALELGNDVGPDRRRDFEMVASEVQIHQALLVNCEAKRAPGTAGSGLADRCKRRARR